MRRYYFDLLKEEWSCSEWLTNNAIKVYFHHSETAHDSHLNRQWYLIQQSFCQKASLFLKYISGKLKNNPIIYIFFILSISNLLLALDILDKWFPDFSAFNLQKKVDKSHILQQVELNKHG